MESDFCEIYFGRYCDNYLVLWCGSKENLNTFHTLLNGKSSPDIKFTKGIWGNSVCFLDLNVSIVKQLLATTVWSKWIHIYFNTSNSAIINHLLMTLERTRGLPCI